MTDRLDRALRATRERETGAHPCAEETLQRVLAERLARQRAWARRARVWIPIAAVLVFSTAALARWGSTAVRALLVARDEAPAASHDVSVSAASVDAPREPPAIEPRAVASAEVPAQMPADLPAAISPPARAHASSTAVTSAPPMVSATHTPGTAPAATGGDSEADVYAHAHRIHFGDGDPRTALAAWDDYLAHFPSGRFAPDARYNRAIDLLKLRRYGEARAALQPFAEGAFGGYRRDDARELLRSIP